MVRLFCLLLLAIATAHADPLPLKEVPDPLKSWVPWVLQDETQFGCPRQNGSNGQASCDWPGTLQLKVHAQGGSFSQDWQIARQTLVSLPGNTEHWPQQVQIDGKPAAVIHKDGNPAVVMDAGEHKLVGQFYWSKMPESLALPPQLALLQLELAGKPVSIPVRDDQNRLWLQRAASTDSEEQTELHIYRRLSEGVPMLLTTTIRLDIAGKARELNLARVLLPDFIAQALDSPLPAKPGQDGSLQIQVKPGHWEITLESRYLGKGDSFGLPADNDSHATASSNADVATRLQASEEIWVYQAAPGIRTVSIEGMSPIDSSQTTLPDAWRKLPAYLMRGGSQMHFKTLQRGDANPDPNKLTLERDLWLHFDGSGFTLADHIKGMVNQAGRLEMAKGDTTLGRIAINQHDQLINLGQSGLAGVEIERGKIDVQAASTIHHASHTLLATGWQSDMEKVALHLHLPPGWRLLHASGPDSVQGSWLSHWNLFDFFLVIITSLSMLKLYGRQWGLLALLALTLAYQEMNAARYVLLPLLAVISLKNLLPQGRWQSLLLWLQRTLLLVLALLLLDFGTDQVLQALYPVLDQHQGQELSTDVPLPTVAVDEPATAPMAAAPAAPPPEPAPAAEAEVQSKSAELAKPTPRAIPKVVLEEAKMAALVSERERVEKQKVGSSLQRRVDTLYSQTDPEARVQTGPGLPQWRHQSHDLTWSGLVLRDQQLHLWLLSPWANRLLTALRLILLAALMARIIGRVPALRPPAATSAVLAVPWLLAALLVTSGLQPAPAQAQMPEKEQLDELRQKLLQPYRCQPDCGDIAHMAVQVAGQQLRLVLDVNAAQDVALPMPGGDKQWRPDQAMLDQKPAFMQRDEEGQLWLLVSKGHHQVSLTGPLFQSDSVQLPLPGKPRHITLQASDWDMQGWSEEHGAADTLQLTRKVKSAGTLAAPQLPPLLRVERKLIFDLTWRVQTTVRRESPPGVPVLASIPLLPGEAVTTADINVKQGQVLLNLGSQASEVSWQATLPQQATLNLQALSQSDPNTTWMETWRISRSGRWHVDYKGLVPVLLQDDNHADLVFMPMPGEALQLAISRPKPVEGPSLTIDRASLKAQPAERSTEYELNLLLRSSRGIDHAITLPKGALLQGVTINQQPQALKANGQQLVLPLTPGQQNIIITWRVPGGIASLYQSQGLDLHLPTSNIKLTLELPAGRWLLWASGPGTGPAILFWGKLVLLLTLGWMLGAQLAQSTGGMSRWQGVLLGLGLSQVSWFMSLILAAWFLLVPRPVPQAGKRRTLILVGHALLTLAMLISLLYAVSSGLLGEPELQVIGNHSDARHLIWFVDRLDASLPTAFSVSLPLLAYRLCMLLWALWLAFALLGWLKWAWQSLSANIKKAGPDEVATA